MDYLILALLLAGIAYMIGVANYGAPSPLSAVRRAVHGPDMSTDNRRSDRVHDDDADTVDMSGHPERGAEDYGALTVSREHAARWGVVPELAHLGGHDDDGPEDGADRLARRVWVRARIAEGKRPEWINREGARRFEVSEKTIRRDRAAVEEDETDE